MHTLVDLMFALLWSVVLFVVVHYAARRFFALARQRTIVATVAVVAYLLGAFLSPLSTSLPLAYDTAPRAAAPRDVSALCRTSKTEDLATNAIGSFDGASNSFDRKPLPSGSVADAARGVTLTGWAIANGGNAVAAGVCLDLDREIVPAKVLYGVLRPDVAAGNKNAALEASGFDIAIPANAMLPGAHVLRIIVIEPDGKRAALSDTRRLVVR